jgi:hypothetical protein
VVHTKCCSGLLPCILSDLKEHLFHLIHPPSELFAFIFLEELYLLLLLLDEILILVNHIHYRLVVDHHIIHSGRGREERSQLLC